MNETKRQTSVEASGLSKVYWDGSRKLEIFKNISMTVEEGECIAILGPSGSGKTTLLNLLSGLDQPTEGDVKLCGVNIHRLSGTERAKFMAMNVGFVFQFYHLLSEFSAIENVMLAAEIRDDGKPRAARKQRAEMLLSKVGLKERLQHFPSELSGGEQQRVAIARALMNEPRILFCDEPTGNLDRAMGNEISEILSQLYQKDKKTMLVVTHDEKIAKKADRVWDMITGEWLRRV